MLEKQKCAFEHLSWKKNPDIPTHFSWHVTVNTTIFFFAFAFLNRQTNEKCMRFTKTKQKNKKKKKNNRKHWNKVLSERLIFHSRHHKGYLFLHRDHSERVVFSGGGRRCLPKKCLSAPIPTLIFVGYKVIWCHSQIVKSDFPFGGWVLERIALCMSDFWRMWGHQNTFERCLVTLDVWRA